MYTVHHETDTIVFERRHLEGAAHSLAAAKDFYFRVGASSRPREVRKFARRPPTGNASACRLMERSGGFAGFRAIRSPAPERKKTPENHVLKSVLIDSDILIEVSRGRDESIIVGWNELSRSDTVPLCSPVTVAELWQGARPHEQKMLSALFAAFTCIAIDLEIGQRAGDYLRQYAKSHHVELGDALIAATASIHKAQLWTRNRRHYPMKEIVFY
jgi:predicted nucleic acid-binding protein